MNIKDAKLCKIIFNAAGIKGMSEKCPARIFNVYQSLDSSDIKRKRQFEQISKIVNDKNYKSIILSDVSKYADNYLPTDKQVNDLYFETYISVLNFLSISKGYFGLCEIPAGSYLIQNGYVKWFNTFGENIFSEKLNNEFLLDSINIGRELLYKNITNQFGPFVQIYFRERNLETPTTTKEIEYFEQKYPELISEIYFEIAVRLIRGIDNIAFNITNCISRDSLNGFKVSKLDFEENKIRNYVIENLRFNPPIAKISRFTENKSSINVEKTIIEPNTQIDFNILEYNRLNKDSFDFNLDSKKEFLSTFGIYTTQSCPAASFTIDFSIAYLKEFWKRYKWIQDIDQDIEFNENKRPDVSGIIIKLP